MFSANTKANTRLFMNVKVAEQSLTKIAGSDNVGTRVSKKAGNSERENVATRSDVNTFTFNIVVFYCQNFASNSLGVCNYGFFVDWLQGEWVHDSNMAAFLGKLISCLHCFDQSDASSYNKHRIFLVLTNNLRKEIESTQVLTLLGIKQK